MSLVFSLKHWERPLSRAGRTRSSMMACYHSPELAGVSVETFNEAVVASATIDMTEELRKKFLKSVLPHGALGGAGQSQSSQPGGARREGAAAAARVQAPRAQQGRGERGQQPRPRHDDGPRRDDQPPRGDRGREPRVARQDGAHEVPRARAAQGEACYAFIKHQLRIPNATGCAAARCYRNHITVGRSVSGAQRADLRAAFVDFPAGEALDTIRAAIAALPRS